jgi:pyruvate, orthophosphate dikinase
MAKKTSARRSRPTKAARPAARKSKRTIAAAATKPAQQKGKWVYGFGDGKAEGKAQMRNLLGGKGANLAEMANLGLPVPPGFTITTEVCTYFYAHGKTYPKELKAQVETALERVGRIAGKGFGDSANPLLVRRARLDAGHDGHRAQSRSQRRDRRGAGKEVGRPPLCL